MARHRPSNRLAAPRTVGAQNPAPAKASPPKENRHDQDLIASLAQLLAAGVASAQQRFVIERDIPGASKMTPEQLRDAATKSNSVLRDLGHDIQWAQSDVAGDKIDCVDNAPSEALIREHASRSGFPANKITPVAAVIDPTTAR